MRPLLLLTCFFLSGFCGLVYQIVWMRLIGHVFGNSVYATATVLAAFMGGLAAGSYLGGRMADRREDRVRLYGVLEICIGIYCVILPLLLGLVTPLYAALYRNFDGPSFWLHLLRAVSCSLFLLIPTTCMGATLPILLRHFVRTQESLGRTVGLVYAINTFGAVAGCVLTGFYLIPMLGIGRTVGAAAALNVLVGVVAVFLLDEKRQAETARGSGPATDGPAGPEELPGGPFSPWEARAALVAFGVSGAAAMIDEVALTRAFNLILGSSTYAFSLMLSSFIFGIGLGSVFLARWVRPGRDLVLGVALTQWGIGLSTVAMLFIIGRLPRLVVALISRHEHSFRSVQTVEFFYLFAITVVPTCLMGLMFPLTTAIWTRRPQSVGRSSGEAYFVNTVGAIAGSLLGGFVLLPVLGVRNSLLAAALLNFANAAWLTLSHRRWRIFRKVGLTVAGIGVGLLLAALIPAWNSDELTSGPYLYAAQSVRPDESAQGAIERESTQQGSILWTKDGTASTVTVKKSRTGMIQLLINGKIDATSRHDMLTQTLFGHVPMLLHPDPRRVLVIGLGSGMTLAAVLRHDLDRADCLEISPEVAYAAERFFGEFNNHCLGDPKARVMIGDGRNHVSLTDRVYDVISSEPSNPWMAGVGNLFTREFWELCRDRLSDDGIMCQWVQAYQLSPEVFRLIVRTFRSVFPECTVWTAQPVDFLLIGSKRPLAIDHTALQARIARERILPDLAQVGIEDAAAFLSRVVTDSEGLGAFVGPGQLHTDDNARLEFDMPRLIHLAQADVHLGLEPHIRPPMHLLGPSSLSAEDRERLTRSHARMWDLTMGHVLRSTEHPELARRRFEKLHRADPAAPEVLFPLFRLLYERSRILYETGKLSQAEEYLKNLLDLYPAVSALQRDEREGVRELFESISPVSEIYAEAATNLGEILRRRGLKAQSAALIDESIAAFRFALDRAPARVRANTNLGALLIMRGKCGEAISYLEAALEQQSDNLGLWLNLGVAKEGVGDEAAAQRCYEQALRVDARFVPVLLRLGGLHEKLRRLLDAARCYETVLSVQPHNRVARAGLGRLEANAVPSGPLPPRASGE